jgi:hypothetical protein
MLHTYVQRFDVTRNLKILPKFLASKRCPTHPIPEPLDPPSRHRLKCLRAHWSTPPTSLPPHSPSPPETIALSSASRERRKRRCDLLLQLPTSRLRSPPARRRAHVVEQSCLLSVVRAIVAFACCCRLLGCPFFASGFIAEFQASSALPGCVRMVDLLVMLRCFVEVYWADGRALGRFKWGWQLESC